MLRYRIPRAWALGALLLALAACASEPKHGRGPGGRGFHADDEDRPKPAPRVRMFISPSGEPFRGENGLATWFAQADTNHDGSLSYAEFEADALRYFKVLDANHDGVIDGFEIQAYERDIVPELSQDLLDERLEPSGGRGRFGSNGGGGGGGGGGRGGGGRGRGAGGSGGGQQTLPTPPAGQPRAGREGAARFGLLNEPEPVANADEDVDGRVSLAEWKHSTQRRFNRLDRAKTGKLILSDLILPPGAKRPEPTPPPAPSR